MLVTKERQKEIAWLIRQRGAIKYWALLLQSDHPSQIPFKTAEDCMKKLENDLQERSVDLEEIPKILKGSTERAIKCQFSYANTMV